MKFKMNPDDSCKVHKIISINNNVANNKNENKKGSSFLVEYSEGIGQEMAQKALNGKEFIVNQVKYSLRIEVSTSHDRLTIKEQDYTRSGNSNNSYPNKWDFVKYPNDGLPNQKAAGPGFEQPGNLDVIQGNLQSDLHAAKYNQNNNNNMYNNQNNSI